MMPLLTRQLKDEAQRLGFPLVGVCPAVTPQGIDRFRDWLASGYHGEMRYLPDRAHAYEHPRHILAGARSILMLAMPYRSSVPRPLGAGQGRVSCYAWGEVDYHDLIHDRLRELQTWLCDQVPLARVRGVVDTAPLLEREFAQLAGLGWVGKNTLLLNRQEGSWFFLAALLTDQELSYDDAHGADHCGTCRACLDACPTHAFPRPYVLDATRCLSYLTIELRGMVPNEFRGAFSEWLFGCDVCQDVCPWNGRAAETAESDFHPRPALDPVDLRSLLVLDDEQFRQRFRQTPLWRARRRGILRNAALLLGNQRVVEAIPELTSALDDSDAIVRSSAAWALGQLDPCARSALLRRLPVEPDEAVRAEITRALAGK